jgi:hypothetical protein
MGARVSMSIERAYSEIKHLPGGCEADSLEVVKEVDRSIQDRCLPSDCLTFYRPSFGRHSKEKASVFGEFDAIVASSQNIYLIESKWDNLTEYKNDKLVIRPEQLMRHQIFSWYLTHWNRTYSNKWADFIKEQQRAFNLRVKRIAPAKSLLAGNLEFVLNKLLERCRTFSSESNIKNVLLFFHREKSRPPRNINKVFTLIAIDYGKEVQSNFVLF